MTEYKPTAARAWSVVGMLWVVVLLNYLDRQLIVTMVEPIRADLHLADMQRFGLFSSVFLWIYGALSLVSGYVADRFGRRRVIIGSLLVWSLVTWLTGHVHTYGQMLAARALMGISEAFYIPAAVALVVDYHRGPTRSRATGLHLSGAYAGAVLGGLGGWLAQTWTWRLAFTRFGMLGVGYALLLCVFLKDPPQESADTSATLAGDRRRVRLGEALRTLLAHRGFLALLLCNALVGAAFWTIKNWLPTLFQQELHITGTRAGIYGTSCFNAAAFLGMMAAAALSDAWSRSTPRARTLVPMFAFAVAAPCVFVGGLAAAVPLMVAAVMIAGMSQGALDANLMPALCTLSESRYRATGYGALNFVSTTAGGLMTYAGGLLKDCHIPFTTTFQIAAIMILGAGLALYCVRLRPTAH
jgi:MFS family permease